MALPRIIAVALVAIMTFAGTAHARHRHRHHGPVHIYEHPAPKGTGILHVGLVTVPTAAGISITVNPSFAQKIVPFIAELVASGYRPRHIGCFARGGHVRNSRHYAGAACDLDQTGWGRTASRMYHVGALAAKYGLRDGATFGDAGHIDDGQPVRSYASAGRHHRYAAHHWRRYGG